MFPIEKHAGGDCTLPELTSSSSFFFLPLNVPISLRLLLFLFEKETFASTWRNRSNWQLFRAAITWISETWKHTAQEWNPSKWPYTITYQRHSQQLPVTSQRETCATAERTAIKQECQILWSDCAFACRWASAQLCIYADVIELYAATAALLPRL